MKFEGTLIIKRPRELVTRLFIDPQYMHAYQDGFKRKELIIGKASELGAISNIYFEQKGRKMLLKETITKNELPSSYEALYEHEHMDNTMVCTFIEIDEHTTEFQYVFEYIILKSFMPKIMMKLFPSMFAKPAHRWMRQFREFVEQYP